MDIIRSYIGPEELRQPLESTIKKVKKFYKKEGVETENFDLELVDIFDEEADVFNHRYNTSTGRIYLSINPFTSMSSNGFEPRWERKFAKKGQRILYKFAEECYGSAEMAKEFADSIFLYLGKTLTDKDDRDFALENIAELRNNIEFKELYLDLCKAFLGSRGVQKHYLMPILVHEVSHKIFQEQTPWNDFIKDATHDAAIKIAYEVRKNNNHKERLTGLADDALINFKTLGPLNALERWTLEAESNLQQFFDEELGAIEEQLGPDASQSYKLRCQLAGLNEDLAGAIACKNNNDKHLDVKFMLPYLYAYIADMEFVSTKRYQKLVDLLKTHRYSELLDKLRTGKEEDIQEFL
jgi:hypothetical protein